MYYNEVITYISEEKTNNKINPGNFTPQTDHVYSNKQIMLANTPTH